MSDSDITPETFAPPKPHPLIASLPPHLKDPKNYDKIRKLIIESLASTHSHGEVIEWATCPSCQRRFAERGDVLKKLGFNSTAQYMAWQQIHETIKQRMPLAKYNS